MLLPWRQSVEEPELRAAETVVVDTVMERFDLLVVLYGDQLTVDMANKAIVSQKEDWTMFKVSTTS